MEDHEPGREGPDGVLGRGFRERFQDRGEAEESGVDEDGGFCRREALIKAVMIV